MEQPGANPFIGDVGEKALTENKGLSNCSLGS
jgi:hypothetical protein